MTEMREADHMSIELDATSKNVINESGEGIKKVYLIVQSMLSNRVHNYMCMFMRLYATS